MSRTLQGTSVILMLWNAAAGAAFAQQAAGTADAAQPVVRLTVDEAVAMALEHNSDLAAERLGPQIGDTAVAAAAGAFRPVFSTSVAQNNQLQPPASFLVPVATSNDATTSQFGITQSLPWLGTSYSLSWNAAHTTSNSFLNSYNPIVQSGLLLTVSQPLTRDRPIDSARAQLAASRVDRTIADTQLRETVVRTTSAVKRAYWNFVSAIANVDARTSALGLAEELVRVNRTKVDVGQSPPLDLVAAEAEAAADREQVILAENAVRTVEDELRSLIFDTSDAAVWKVQIEPVDGPPVRQEAPDLDSAVANALRDRTDLARARKEIERADVTVKLTGNQRLPDVRINASYLASGLGGTQLLRTDGFPGTIVGSGSATSFGSVLNQLFTGQYSTWTAGINVSYPLGQTTAEANHVRARLERAQGTEHLKSAEASAVRQVRDAWRQIETNARRIDTARAARELADERLDAEQKRFDVGMSTSFLVIQAQRDLVQAKTNEVAATLAYALALVSFDAVQQASPAPDAAGQSPQ